MTVRRRVGCACRGQSNASSARMPPSPWLSARMMRMAYLTEITTMSDQKINETTPSTASGATVPAGLAAFAATLRV
jgi:hypothetical protein